MKKKERKETFTYACEPSVVELAKRAAKEKDDTTLSKKIGDYVNEYAKSMFPSLYNAAKKASNVDSK